MDARRILQKVADGTLNVDEAERQIKALGTADTSLKDKLVLSAMSARSPIWMISIGFTVLGTVFAILGMVDCFRSWKLSTQGRETDGIVVRTIYKGQSDHLESARAPIVRYSVGDKSYEVEGSTSTAVEVGQTLPVYYLPDHPSEAMLATFRARWMEPMMFTLLGTAFAVTGIALFIAQRREQRQQQ